ncbi:MAG: biotin/lipoyl-binding protein [Actinomycetota bacterium]
MLTAAVLANLVVVVGRALWGLLGLAPPDDAPRLDRAPRVVQASGVVVSSIAKGVGSPFSGTVESLQVKKGQRVTRGQLLFRMDIRPLQRQLERTRAEARRAAAEVEDGRRRRAATVASATETLSDLKRRIDVVAARSRPAFATVAAVGSLQPEGPAELADRMRILVAHRARQRRQWDARISVALAQRLQAEESVKELTQLMRQAKRFSPINGVVTSIRAGEGDWVKGAVPVVRVDDPKGYQVVMLLRDRAGVTPSAGAQLQVRADAGVTECQVTETLKGWDRELFSTWVKLTPHDPAALTPGQEVEVLLPRVPEPASETASRASAQPSTQ